MVMGMNMRTGQLEIGEYDGQIRGQMSINEILEEGKKAGEEIMETADKMIAAQQATGDAEVAAGEPLDLRKRGQQSPETETPEEKPEPDFDPETGEIFENGKGGKVIAMAKQA